MKKKYLITGGIAFIVAGLIYLKLRAKRSMGKLISNGRNQNAAAERHIREIMKKAKPVV